MDKTKKYTRALAAAFPHTLPIMAGFLFLGTTYGVYMRVSGFGFLYPMIMSLVIYGGSLQFMLVGFLVGAFDPIGALLLTFMINARHLFYGIAMLEKYRVKGAVKKLLLIFTLADESFSVNCSAEPPEGVDRSLFMFFASMLMYAYWFAGSAIGGLLGSLVNFNTEGLDFVMTAMFVVIFLENWLKEKNHWSSLMGLILPVACLLIFGAERFMIPAMLAILAALTLLRSPIEKAGESA